MKKKVIRIIDLILLRCGYERKRNLNQDMYSKNNLLMNLFITLKIIGFSPKHILDIGANHGTWTREVLKYSPNSYFTLLEPQSWLKSSFQDLLENNEKIRYFPYGAGEETGHFNFTISNSDDSSSFRYNRIEASKLGYRQLKIQVITINDLLKKLIDLPHPDLIKIDAEGLDLEVLKGADEIFGKTEIIMIESAVFNKNFDNSVYNVINFMNTKDYILFDITDLNRPYYPKILWLMELVFIKKNGIIYNYHLKYD